MDELRERPGQEQIVLHFLVQSGGFKRDRLAPRDRESTHYFICPFVFAGQISAGPGFVSNRILIHSNLCAKQRDIGVAVRASRGMAIWCIYFGFGGSM